MTPWYIVPIWEGFSLSCYSALYIGIARLIAVIQRLVLDVCCWLNALRGYKEARCLCQTTILAAVRVAPLQKTRVPWRLEALVLVDTYINTD